MLRITMLPARDGDCFLIEAGDCRILVDGGRDETGKTVLPAALSRLPQRLGPTLDLMILTHVDSDHVEGLLTLLAGDTPFTVGDVWFNGYHHHAIAAGVSKAVARPERASSNKEGMLSVRQALDFSNLLQRRGFKWNARFQSDAIAIPGDGTLPRTDIGDDTRLTLLGPTHEKLKVLFPEWKREFERKAKPETLAGSPMPTLANLTALANAKDRPDPSKANGASIAFVVEHAGKKALFTGDAHAGDILNALRIYDPATQTFSFDAVKVSHHGSKRNNTSGLIGALDTPLWLISTDGTGHEHPDAECLARIALSPRQGKRIAFNYSTDQTAPWSDEALQAECKYRTQYGDGLTSLAFEV